MDFAGDSPPLLFANRLQAGAKRAQLLERLLQPIHHPSQDGDAEHDGEAQPPFPKRRERLCLPRERDPNPLRGREAGCRHCGVVHAGDRHAHQ
jgi:hypothetical protein